MSLGFRNRSVRSSHTVVIGFDFGTHSTKVVYRVRGERMGRIIQLDVPISGYPSAAAPSLVRCVDGKLFFGTDAKLGFGGNLYSSLKISLLPNVRCPQAFPRGMDNRILVVAYFWWAFQAARDALSDIENANILVNVAAPMAYCENEQLKSTYLMIVQAAWKLAFEDRQLIWQGISSDRVLDRIGSVFDIPVQPPEERRFEVLPETIAPVVSMSLDPLRAPGMYMVIDTGAGTTEMSVFHAGEFGIDQKVLCYFDDTMLLGGNDLHFAESCGSTRREHLVQEITTRLAKNYKQVWYKGYCCDKNNHLARKRWKELTLMLSGGGTRHVSVQNVLCMTNPVILAPKDAVMPSVNWHHPGMLEQMDDVKNEHLPFFAVANGLAIERVHWPKIIQPHEVEVLAHTECNTDKPMGYWYLDK